MFRRIWSHTSLVIVAPALACILLSGASGRAAAQGEPVNYVVAPIPTCSADQVSSWTKTWNNSQGIAPHDPYSHYVGYYSADNWRPIDAYKQRACGTLHSYGWYDPWGDEADWNLNIIPNAAYAYLINDVRPRVGGGIRDCPPGTDNCMQQEITPDENFYGNPWFPTTSSSPLQNRTVCTYGPWVQDAGHKHRPEIHPAELVWWTRGLGNGPYFMMVVQDDSNRFDRTSDFSPTPSSGWVPWSAYPRAGSFAVAFYYDITWSTGYNLCLHQHYARKVVTSLDTHSPPAYADADDGTQHAVQLDSSTGRIAVRVTEMQPGDDDVGVTFIQVCRDPSIFTRIQGYIQIRTKVGVGDRGNEGYHVLSLSSSASPPAPLLARLAQEGEVAVGEGDARSLRVAGIGGRNQLVGDVELHFEAGEGASPDQVTVTKAELVTSEARMELAFKADPEARSVSIQAMPVLLGAQVALTMKSGATITVDLQGHALFPSVSEDARDLAGAEPAAWTGMVRAASRSLPSSATKGSEGPAQGDLSSPSGIQTMKAGLWEVQIVPRYVPLREGEPAGEEEAKPLEGVNEALATGDAAEISKIYGSEQPFSVQWSFQATDLSTGATVPVKVGEKAASGEISVEVRQGLSGAVRDGALALAFPREPGGADTIYEVVATARVSDPFGLTGEVQHRVWSHLLSSEAPEQLADALLPAVAEATEATGMPPDLVAASKLDNPEANDPLGIEHERSRRARMVRVAALQAAADQRVTIGELQKVIGGAMQFAISPVQRPVATGGVPGAEAPR